MRNTQRIQKSARIIPRTESGSIVLCDVHLVLWCSWFGNRKDIQPVKCWVLVCWWWSFDWSFARLISAVITITSSPPPFLAPIKSRMETFWWSKRVGWDGLDMLKYSCRGKWPLIECRYDVWTGNRPGTFYIRVLPGEFTWSSLLPRCWLSNRKGSRLVYNLTPAIPVVFIQKLMMSWRNPWWRWKIGSLCAFYQVYLCWPVVAIKLFPRNFRFFVGGLFFIYTPITMILGLVVTGSMPAGQLSVYQPQPFAQSLVCYAVCVIHV